MKIIFCLLVFVQVGFSFSQFDIKWSELIPSKGRVSSLYPVSFSDFYTTRFQGSMMFTSQFVAKHTDFKITSKAKVTPKLQNGIGVLEDLKIIKGVPVSFISDIKEGSNSLYIQKYSSTCEAIGFPKKICSYDIPKGWKRKGFYNTHISKNNEYICVNYEIPGSKEEKNKFGFKVFDFDFEVITEGEYEIPYPTNLVALSNYYLSDKGDFFFALKVYEVNQNKRIGNSRLNLDKVVLYQATKSGIEEFDLGFKVGKTLSDFTFSSDDNRILTFTGLFGELKQNGINGVFYFQLDFDKKQIIKEGWKEFGKEFITDDWTEREKEKAEKREAKGKGEPQLYQYDVRDILTLQDGSMIGILEQYYVKIVSSTDPRTGSTSTTYYYYYNDIILYKVNPKGDFAWLKKINKTQVSTNDNGYFSSIAYFTSKDKLNIFFNDNARNYTESGEFNTKEDRLYPASYRKKTNVFAHIEVDIENGDLQRKTFFKRNEVNAFAVPKKFNVDYTKKEMLMLLLYGKKEKFGILSFE